MGVNGFQIPHLSRTIANKAIGENHNAPNNMSGKNGARNSEATVMMSSVHSTQRGMVIFGPLVYLAERAGKVRKRA